MILREGEQSYKAAIRHPLYIIILEFKKVLFCVGFLFHKRYTLLLRRIPLLKYLYACIGFWLIIRQ